MKKKCTTAGRGGGDKYELVQGNLIWRGSPLFCTDGPTDYGAAPKEVNFLFGPEY